MTNHVKTAIITDGGRKIKKGYKGFDAAYKKVFGREIISYSIQAAVESKSIRNIYLYSDFEEKAFKIAKELYSNNKNLIILSAKNQIPKTNSDNKILRIVPSEDKLVKSIQRTVYQYITKDLSGLEDFLGDWKSKKDITKYQKQNPAFRELPIFFMSNDVPLLKSSDIDHLIEAYDSTKNDSVIGYTKKSVLEKYLTESEIDISQFHKNLKKCEYINGEPMRHNCLFIIKWGKTDNNLQEIISFYNSHRVQSKISNLAKVIGKIIKTYNGGTGKRIKIIRHCIQNLPPFFIGKYMNNFYSKKVAKWVTKNINNKKLEKISEKITNHKISIDDKGSAQSLLDIDKEKDITSIKKIILKKEIIATKEKIHQLKK